MTSWIEIPADSDFTVANIPFGIFSTLATPPRPCTRVGDDIFSLSILAEGGLFDNTPSFPRSIHHTLHTPTLNAFAALGPIVTNAVRKHLQWLFAPSSPDLRDDALLLSQAKLTLDQTPTPHLPFTIGDYTDFYAGRNHAYAVGTLFRGAENALNANYESLPIGYHGRSSSIVVSGTPVRRPHGQILRGDEKNPVHAPTEKLDFELELAAFVGVPSELGEPVNMRDAPNHIFGFVLMNDWSARDVQRWEYVPLGPFTSKSFATTVSPWVVTAAAMEGFRVVQMERWSKVPLLGYLKGEEGYKGVFDGRLEVGVAGETVGRVGARELVWGWEQMLVQQTVGGCNLRTGDLLGSGTISGSGEGEGGSLLEKGGGFLRDGEEVVMRGWCGEGEGRVGFGECRGKILPAKA